VSRTVKKLEAVEEEIKKINPGVQTKIIQADFCGNATKEFYEELFEKIIQSLPQGHSVALVVNNAGMIIIGLFEKFSAKDCTDMVDLNVTQVVMLSKLFVDYFMSSRKPKGLKCGLINVSSLAAYSEGAALAIYASTKAFVNFFTHPVAFELEKDIDIQCLTPSLTKTNLLHGT